MRRIGGALSVVGLWLLLGCGGEGSGSAPSRLKAADFAAEGEVAAVGTKQEAAGGRSVGRVAAAGGIDDVRVVVGEPGLPARAVKSEERAEGEEGVAAVASSAGVSGGARIETMVGQINGRPVYASDFFAPMDSRLRAEAKKRQRADWMRYMREQVWNALRDRVRDELLLAEFQASLTPEQKLGVLAFAETLRSGLIRENLGSSELANRRFLEEEGLTLEDKIRLERDKELIRVQIRKVIGDRAYVAWREVVLAYEREEDLFRPAGKATFRIIQVPDGDADRLERVRTALAGGESFEEVAKRESAFNASNGGIVEVTAPGAWEEATIFAAEELNVVARGLTAGMTSEPFQWSGSTVWLRLESLDRPPAKTLYDAQLDVYEALRRAQIAKEEARYFDQILSRASVSDLNKMRAELEAIAVERYLVGAAR